MASWSDLTDYGDDPETLAAAQAQSMGNIPAELWNNMSLLEQAALVTSPVPVLGSLLGVAADADAAWNRPDEFFEPTNLALTGASYMPWGRMLKYGPQLGIIAKPHPSEAAKLEKVFAESKNADEAWLRSADEIGKPAYMAPDRKLRVVTSDADTNWKRHDGPSQEQFYADAEKATVVKDNEPTFTFDPDGRPGQDAASYTATMPRPDGSGSYYGYGLTPDEAKASLARNAYNSSIPRNMPNLEFPESSSWRTYNLDEIYDDPEFMRQMGQTGRNMQVNFDPELPAKGSYHSGLIKLNPRLLNNAADLRSTLLHEGQHAYQDLYNLPRGGNEQVATNMIDSAKDLSGLAGKELERLRARELEFLTDNGFDNAWNLRGAAMRMAEMDRLQGYLDDYYRTGNNLTNKRRHIFNSGGFLNDANADYRMRMDTFRTSRNAPTARRNPEFVSYIEQTLENARNGLDPDLVDQVRASGVANPAAKYQRQMDNLRRQWDLGEGKNVQALRDENSALSGFYERYAPSGRYNEVPGAHRAYRDLAGEAEARLRQDFRDMSLDEIIANRPWNMPSFQTSPLGQQIVRDRVGNILNINGMQPGSLSRGLLDIEDFGRYD